MKKLLALLVAIILIGCNKNLARISENEHYSDAYEATVRVFAMPNMFNFFASPKMGTGVLLDTGLILTARHVVDVNEDGFIDPLEAVVEVKFYYPTAYVTTATVVSNPLSNWHMSEDFVFLRIPHPPKSNVHLMSNEDYRKIMKVGEPVFAVGLSKGTEPPHITVGVKSTDVNDGQDARAAISIYYGNSGGGIYSDRTGELIGITTAISLNPERGGEIVPQWSIFESAPTIRRHAVNSHLPYMVDKQLSFTDKLTRDFIAIYIIQGIVWMYLGVIVRELYLLSRARSAPR